MAAQTQTRPKPTSVRDVLARYPIRNPIWIESDGVFISDISEGGRRQRDPWNRQLPIPSKVQRDNEGDVMAWTYRTSVAGYPIPLVILND